MVCPGIQRRQSESYISVLVDYKPEACQRTDLSSAPLKPYHSEPVELGLETNEYTTGLRIRSKEWKHAITGLRAVQLFRVLLGFESEGSKVRTDVVARGMGLRFHSTSSCAIG